MAIHTTTIPVTEPGHPIAMSISVTLRAIVHEEEGRGYSAEVPDLPGCFTDGATLEEIRVRLVEAIESYLMAIPSLMKPLNARPDHPVTANPVADVRGGRGVELE